VEGAFGLAEEKTDVEGAVEDVGVGEGGVVTVMMNVNRVTLILARWRKRESNWVRGGVYREREQ